MERRRPEFSQQTDTQSKIRFDIPIFDEKFEFGSIMKIKLKRFMAYEEITICPSPGTNLIVGTNGSGKSTIIAAIGLCFGATPNKINKNSNYQSFIKNGHDSAVIKITLYDQPPITVICSLSRSEPIRWRFKQMKKSSEELSKQKLVELTNKYHIHVDNLCMYLPQERVKEFAALKPPELLSETLNVISPSLAAEQSDIEKSISAVEKLKKVYEKKNSELQRETDIMKTQQRSVEKLKDKEKGEKELELIKTRICYVNAKTAEIEYRELKKEVHEEKAKAREADQIYKEIADEYYKAKEQHDTIEAETIAATTVLENYRKEVEGLRQQYFENDGKRKTLKKKLETISSDMCQRQIKKEQHEETLKKLEKNKMDQSEIDKLSETKKELFDKRLQLSTANDELKLERESLKETEKKKKEKLEEIRRNIEKARYQRDRIIDKIVEKYGRDDIRMLCDFIKNNKNTFAGPVYGPAVAEVVFPEPIYSKYFDAAVNRDFQFAFIVVEESDFIMIEEHCKLQKLSQITLTRNAHKDNDQSENRYDLTGKGFEKYLDQVFEAPDVVKDFLIKMAHINKIPVSIRGSDVEPREMFDLGIRRFFIQDRSFTIRKSRYCNEISSMITLVRPSIFWTGIQSAPNGISSLKAKEIKTSEKLNTIRADIKSKGDEMKQASNKIAEYTKKIEEVDRKIRDKKNINKKIGEFRRLIDGINKEMENEINAPIIYKDKLKDCIEKSWKMLRELISAIEGFHEQFKTWQQKMFKDQKAEKKEKELYEEKQKKEDKRNEIIIKYRTDKEKYERAKEILASANDKVRTFSQEERMQIDGFPNDLNTLKCLMEQCKGKIKSAFDIPDNINEEFEKTKKKVAALEAEVAKMQEDIEMQENNYREKRNRWEKSVNDIIKKISTAFSRMMSDCGFSGSIKLNIEGENENSMKYRIDLFVSFKADMKQSILSSTRQSGGEKSVATFLYLLALQSCTNFPFRVIDEINQGMDEENELTTFNHAMNCALGQNEQTQYFFVTPKLNSGLNIKESVQVIILISGPGIEPVFKKPVLLKDYADKEEDSDDE